MNKMDLNVTQEAPDSEKPVWAVNSFAGKAKRLAVVAAPLVVLLGGGALLALMILTGPKPEEKNDAPHPPAVQFAVAQSRPTTISISVQGEARPRVEATLAAQVAGRIVWASPAFVDGGSFREGDVLARVDAADYQLAVVRARAQVAQSEEALTREEAEGELARQDWQALGRGDPPPLAVREPQLAQARAQLAASQAGLRSAELDLSRASIRAPFTGRIRERRANVGDYVGPASPVAVMFATDAMEIRVPLTDADLASMRVPVGFTATAANPGPVAHVSQVSGGRIRTWQGRLVRVEASVDARTRLVYGVVEVRDPFNARNAAPLAPGMFPTIRLEGSARETLVAAPRSALKRNEYVYVVRPDNTIDVREVRAAQTTADEVLFREGVADGERVVVSVLTSPRQGMAVTPIDRAGGSAQPAAAPAAAPAQPSSGN
ncbi:efflux RND transporter periplasmic adaptor subunit [Terricaulis silvestris]|uniref:Multidrug transporter MdtA n=1 Tax=Terricaulis silvestris TaxID=2686094 RepID=A0A6I6MMX8_9CAUL|nr:efflux RND transporter periplasmic adaptor subunit [Terricaulis silvestris]QGZ94087.1 Multidrug transporter MdtA [Terricaulis silvestris]